MRLTRNSQENDAGPKNGGTSHYRSHENVPNRLYRSTRKPSANAATPATPASQHCHTPSVETPVAPTVQANQMRGQTQRQTPQDGTSPHPPRPQDKSRKNRDHFPTPPSSHITDPVYHRHREFKGGSQRRVSKVHEPHDGIHRRIKPQRPSGSRRSSLHRPQPHRNTMTPPRESHRTHSVRSRSCRTPPRSSATNPKKRSQFPRNNIRRQSSSHTLQHTPYG